MTAHTLKYMQYFEVFIVIHTLVLGNNIAVFGPCVGIIRVREVKFIVRRNELYIDN